MLRQVSSWVSKYLLGFITVSAALLLRFIVPINPTPLFLLALILSAWFGSRVQGLIAALLIEISVEVYFENPPWQIDPGFSNINRLAIVVVIALLASARKRAEEKTRARAQQQAAVAGFGQRALEGKELPLLVDEAAKVVAETLRVEIAAVLELMPERDTLLLIAGAGLKEGLIGKEVVASGTGSLSGFTLLTGGPVIVKDLARETRFKVQPTLKERGVTCSMSVIINGPERPYGVLVAHTVRKTIFTQDDINFVQSVANVLSTAIERKRAEEALKAQQRWLENVLDLMPTPLLLIEPGTARVTFANKAADEMAGGQFPKAAHSGQNETEYYCTDQQGNRIPDDEMPGALAARGEVIDGLQMNWHTPRGVRSIIVFAKMLEAAHGHTSSVVLVFQDITELKQVEAALQRASRLKDEFLATVSHELRTPLNAILGWAGMVRSGRLDSNAVARALESIERNAKSQAQIIGDLLDVSRIITGKLRLEVQPVDLIPVIEAAADAVRPAIEAKSIRLQLVLNPETGPVLGDPDRLQQIVWNLLSNAVRFTPREGRIQVSLERINSHVEITVSDTGSGISPDFLPFVFDRFRQADSSFTRAHGGLGLGLSIVRHLVELQGGTVSAHSDGEGSGATFVVQLPLLIAHDSGRLAGKPIQWDAPVVELSNVFDRSPSLEGLRVLVVDDEADARELLSVILGQCGATVTPVGSVAEALDEIEKARPNILLSDIEMPGEDGYLLIRKLREQERKNGGRIPAAALTAHARVEDRMRALSAGFDTHVAKPVEPVELVTVIASLARRTAQL